MNKLTRGAVLAGVLYTGANANNTPEVSAHEDYFKQSCDNATVTFEDMSGHPYLKSHLPSVMVDSVVVVTLTQDELNQGKTVKNIEIKGSNKVVETSWAVDWNGNNTLDAGEKYGSTYPLSFDDCKVETPVTTTTMPTPTTTAPVPTTTITEVELAPPQEPVVANPEQPEIGTPEIIERKRLAETGGAIERNVRVGVLTLAAGLLINRLGNRRQDKAKKQTVR